MAVNKYKKSASKLSSWLLANVPDGLTVFALPIAHRRRLRTSNLLERLNKEIKRRTRVATLFPNEASLLRLVSAVLMEISEEWETVAWSHMKNEFTEISCWIMFPRKSVLWKKREINTRANSKSRPCVI
jgi:transposase-like protein